jgi:hypothetical protein
VTELNVFCPIKSRPIAPPLTTRSQNESPEVVTEDATRLLLDVDTIVDVPASNAVRGSDELKNAAVRSVIVLFLK